MMKLSCQEIALFWAFRGSQAIAAHRRTLVPTYRVGEPLQRGRRQWPVGSQYAYGPNGHELTLFLDELNDDVIRDVRQGEAEFAVFVRPSVLLLAYRFGESIPWSDVPYCMHMHPEHTRATPPPIATSESRALLWVTLVGAQDGLIHAQRGLTLDPDFTRVLHTAIQEQSMLSFSPDACLHAVGELLLSHRDTLARLELAEARAIANQ